MDDWFDAARDEMISDLYNDFAKDLFSGRGDLYIEVIEHFTSERLQSFYVDNPDLANRAIDALKEARALATTHPTAALIFAVTAAEVGLKTALLKPIIHGLVHMDSVAAIIADLIPEQRNDKFRELLFTILKECGGVDLSAFKRSGVTQTAWEEISLLQKKRNRILHQAEKASFAEASHAIELAVTVLEGFFPTVLAKLGLHTHIFNGLTWVCEKWHDKP
jgi:hypothetical protein